ALIDHSGQTPGALSDLREVLELC
ncbi:MAG TPA: hydrolase, partial [Deinococcus radiodurans]|nr:hydrolase [Deinococcus radiodurans]